MPSTTKRQQRFFAMIHQANKNHKRLKGQARKVQKQMTDKQVKHFTKLEENNQIWESYNQSTPICAIAFNVNRLGIHNTRLITHPLHLQYILSTTHSQNIDDNLYKVFDRINPSTEYYYMIHDFTPQTWVKFNNIISQLSNGLTIESFPTSLNRLINQFKTYYPKESKPLLNYIKYHNMETDNVKSDEIAEMFDESYNTDNNKLPICLIEFVPTYKNVYICGLDDFKDNIETVCNSFDKIDTNTYRSVETGDTYFYAVYEFTPKTWIEFSDVVYKLNYGAKLDDLVLAKKRLIKKLEYEFPKESKPLVNYIKYHNMEVDGIDSNEISELFG